MKIVARDIANRNMRTKIKKNGTFCASQKYVIKTVTRCFVIGIDKTGQVDTTLIVQQSIRACWKRLVYLNLLALIHLLLPHYK